MSSATARALALPEILESIFVNLSFFDLLLRIRLVCKNFHQVVNTAPTLLWKTFRLKNTPPGLHHPRVEVHTPFFERIGRKHIRAIRPGIYHGDLSPEGLVGALRRSVGYKSHFVTRPALETIKVEMGPSSSTALTELVIRLEGGVTVDHFLKEFYRWVVENVETLARVHQRNYSDNWDQLKVIVRGGSFLRPPEEPSLLCWISFWTNSNDNF